MEVNRPYLSFARGQRTLQHADVVAAAITGGRNENDECGWQRPLSLAESN